MWEINIRNLGKNSLVTNFGWHSCCQPSWMVKMNATKMTFPKFGSIFIFSMLSVILAGSQYQKSQNWLPWLYHRRKRLVMKNLPLLCLIQFDHIGGHVGWKPLRDITKTVAKSLVLKTPATITDLCSGQFSTWICCWPLPEINQIA